MREGKVKDPLEVGFELFGRGGGLNLSNSFSEFDTSQSSSAISPALITTTTKRSTASTQKALIRELDFVKSVGMRCLLYPLKMRDLMNARIKAR